MSEEDDEIVLQLADPPNCPRCGGPGPVSARFPHSWKNAGGEEVPGMWEGTLCPVCDRDEPAAGGLLAFFAVHKTLEPSELETFHNLSAAWVAVARARHVDQQQLADEYERSRNGEL
ncbi:DUF6300 family protein [Streptomyces sp. NBC_01763]|uniref:DUF6300 family protein n=1 Tax=Streptomyces sp. NBC_01763 TaxID=2975934 RepID=UPI002DDBFFE9|nr:DUF6300 family protein [Streptomyces sp. NBC_01763]WSC40097.1 DUF6300 family protein [Streptomyces sp. NBC_01763]